MASHTAEALTELSKRQHELDVAVIAYQMALLAARHAGATWPEMAKAMGTDKTNRPRHRHAAARVGGEMHISFPVLTTIPLPREETG